MEVYVLRVTYTNYGSYNNFCDLWVFSTLADACTAIRTQYEKSRDTIKSYYNYGNIYDDWDATAPEKGFELSGETDDEIVICGAITKQTVL